MIKINDFMMIGNNGFILRLNLFTVSFLFVFLRLIVDLAVMRNGIILSNDFYRDILKDSGVAVGKAIRERLIEYSKNRMS